MCLGNRARAASDYVNSQLRALYENAVYCVGHLGSGSERTKTAGVYSTCLAEFCGPEKHRQQYSTIGHAFFVKFGQPRVDFICNHKLILKLSILEAYCTREGQKVDTQQKEIQNVGVAFRIVFKTHVGGLQYRFNGRDLITTIYALDVTTAHFMTEHSTSEGISDKNELPNYLKSNYLPLLEKAGHYAFYSLPDLSNLPIDTFYINYSLLREDSITVDKIYDIHARDINMYLRGLWSQAYYYVLENGVHEDNINETFLSEMRIPITISNEKRTLKLVLEPMQVRLLFYILDENEEVPHESVNDVTVSYIVGVKYTKSNEGISKQIEVIDFKPDGYCEHLSNFKTCEGTRFKELLKTFITRYFIKFLGDSGSMTIFCHDTRTHGVEGDLEGSDETDIPESGEPRDEVINGGSYEDFGLVMALSRQYINTQFRRLWEMAIERRKDENVQESEYSLAYFTYCDPKHEQLLFSSTFLEPKVQLSCEGGGSRSVILYITLEKGKLVPLGPGKQLQPGAEIYPFSRWRLAFDVKLNIEDSSEEVTQRTIHNRLDHQQSAKFKQLVLRLETAELKLNLSFLPGLVESDDYRQTVSRLHPLVYYIQTQYFPALTRGLHHILYSIPQNVSYLQQTTDLEIQFDVVPFEPIPEFPVLRDIHSISNYFFDRNVIVIWYAKKKDEESFKPIPNHPPKPSFWKNSLYGSLCLPYNAFVGRTLALLRRVNRETTIVPRVSRLASGQWKIKLETWGDTEAAEATFHACMLPQPDCTNSLDYVYKNRNFLLYEHEGCSSNGKYEIESITKNVLSLPIQRSETPEIKIKGEVELNLSCKIPDLREWSANIFVSWEAGIKLISSPSGLQVVLQQQSVVPTFRKGVLSQNVNSTVYAAVFDQVRKIFPENIDCGDFVSEWNSCLSGSWTGLREMAQGFRVTRPIFNKQGDLFLEFAIQSPISESPMTLAF